MARMLLGFLVLAFAIADGVLAQDYSEEGGAACADCHDTPEVMGILDTPHADFDDPRTPAAQKQCQSCHGPSAQHMRFPMQVANVHFGRKSGSEAEVQNEMCIACHGTTEQKEAWHVSAHGYEKVVCSTCHSLHDPDRTVLTNAAISERCLECHGNLLAGADFSSFSHAVGQPIDGGGELTCAGCHNPHGRLESSRCLDCHSQAPEVLARQSEKARRYHEVAAEHGTECMRCHKGLSHPITPLEEASTLQGIRPGGAIKGLPAP